MQIETLKSTAVPAQARPAPDRLPPGSTAASSTPCVAVPGLSVPRTHAPGIGVPPRGDVVGALRRRSATSPPVVRRLFSDSTLSIVGIRSKLTASYPNDVAKFTYSKVAPLLADVDTTYTWEQLVAKLGLTATEPDTNTAPVTAKATPIVPDTSSPARKPAPVQSQQSNPSPVPVTAEVPVNAEPLPTPSARDQQPAVTASKPGNLDAVKLREQVHGVFAAAKKPNAPTRDEIMGMITKHYSSEVVESAEFAYAYQDAVRAMIKDTAFLTKSAITDVEDTSVDVSKHKMGDLGKWKLRHYTTAGTDTEPPPFKQVKSAMALSMTAPTGGKEAVVDGPSASGDTASGTQTPQKVDTRKSGHTGDRDWNRYGNTGNTFYVLVLDGVLPEKQKFLENTKWYAEISFDQPSLWISSDWLDESGIKPGAFRGTGKAVQKQLLKLGGNVPGDLFRKALMTHFNNLEVKVPGTVAVDTWHKAKTSA